MKVAILGANGQLGADVATAFRAQGDDVGTEAHGEVFRDLERLLRERARARRRRAGLEC